MVRSKTICLNMIVKNEGKVIKRCLESVLGLFQYWVIVDTGSTDGTQKIIEEVLRDIPGQLHERPWEGFEKSRNIALELAYPLAHYLLFIDADETLQKSETFSLKELDGDIYFINVRAPNDARFLRQFMISTRIPWFWRGVIHEQIYTTEKTIAKRFIKDSVIVTRKKGGGQATIPARNILKMRRR